MKKVLIAYFFHEGEAYVGGKIVKLKIGNTRAAAQMIHGLTGGDVFRIETEKPYPDALLMFYILTSFANCHAQDWWELTYAKYLYPKARMASQRISEALADIGCEDAKRRFFKAYFRFLGQCPDFDKAKSSKGIDDGILIDSSGLPNAIYFPFTAVNNHNGVISG